MRRQLAQTRPSDTNAATALSSTAPWTVDLIIIANTSAQTATFSIYHDADGSTYDESTAVAFNLQVDANDIAFIQLPMSNYDRTGTLGVKSGTASALTFTVYGYIDGERI